MILDNDNIILEQTKMLTLVQKCVDVFIECFTIDRDLSSPVHVRGFFTAGKYDKDKVRNFYISKESKFRKEIKKAEKGLNVSIWKDFHGYSNDTILYNFYYDSTFIFNLKLLLEDKSITYNTYREISYCVETSNELIKKSLNLKDKQGRTVINV